MNSNWPVTFVVVEAIVKTSIILAAVGLICLALRKKYPAVSHFLWVLGFAGAIAVPILAPFVPGNNVLTIHPPIERESASLLSNPGPKTSLPQGYDAAPVPGPGKSLQAFADQTPAQTPAVPAWLRIAAIVWIVGAVAVGLRTAIGLYALRVMRRFGTVPFDFDSVDLDVDRVAVRAHQHRDWELRQAANESLTVPMTWGIVRPIVVLPKNAETWLEKRLEAVLLHELAHVRRYDFASQLLADFACALYWFNPIAWLGAHAMRADAELAADDSVLRAGVKASDYATELLQIAADIGRRRQPFAYLGTPAMKNSNIESRLESVLAPSAGRRGVTSIQALAAIAAVVIALPGLASLHATTRQASGERPKEEITEAVSRVKQACLASLMYAADYDEMLPYAQQTETVAGVLDPYTKNPKVYESPTEGGRFLFNLNLGGVLKTTVPDPAQTPLWLEVLKDKNAPFVVGYLDGHAKIKTPDQRDFILKASKIRFARPKTSKPLPAGYMVQKKKD